MGKIRTRTLGLEDEEKKQKEKQKKKRLEKKSKEEITEKEPHSTPSTRGSVRGKQPVARTRGKKYISSKKGIDKNKLYSLTEAIELLKKVKYSKFDESVEVHLNLEQTGMRGEVELPHLIGKTTRVAIVSDEVLSDIEKGNLNFDVLITHPSFMPKLARFAKVLGPKGLMPNPKAGTISANPEETAKKFVKGTLRWKSEAKFPLLHQMVGKISFEDSKIAENIQALLKSVGRSNIRSAYIKTTMSPALKLNIE